MKHMIMFWYGIKELWEVAALFMMLLICSAGVWFESKALVFFGAAVGVLTGLSTIFVAFYQMGKIIMDEKAGGE